MIVGNEVLLRRDLTVSEMIAYISQVRTRIPSGVQITTAETDNIWMAEAYSREQTDALVDSIDYITVHIYPYWAGLSIDGVAGRVIARVREIQRRYPHKRVVIGETGWPSAGQTNYSAVPTLENQRRFYREFLLAAEAANIEYYYFDPFDELWKRWPDRQHGGEGEAGANWGVGYSDRTSKHPMWGVLLNSTALQPSRLYLPMTLRGIATHDGIGAANVRELPVWSVKPAVDMMARWESAAALPASGAKVTGTKPQLNDFQVFTEWSMPSNHFAPSGYMGDQADIDLYECERTEPHSGELSMRVTYSATGTSGWSGVYWQDPDGNWGTLPGGYDLTGATRLSFWAKGQNGGEVIAFKAGGLWGSHGDSLQPAAATGPLALATEWRQYSIDLRGQDLSQIIGGFAWVANRCSNPQGATFYLDDIAYEFDPTPPPIPTPTPTPNVPYSLDVYTDQDAPANHYVPSGFMGDYQAVQLTECWTQNTHTGRTAISSAYMYGPTGSGSKNWAGVYWLHPADNWADRPGGYNLSGAQALMFWAGGQDGGERVKFQVGGVVSGTSPYNDSVPTPVPIENTITLGRNWQQYTIPLPSSLDLGHVVGGFLWSSDWMHNCEAHPQGVTFYLDDIRYWYNLPVPPAPVPTPAPIRASFPFAVYSDGQRCGNHFVPSGWMGDTGDIDVLESYTGVAHSGSTSIRVRYDAQGLGPATCGYQSPCRWSGVYWQEPANNWANLPGGYDLTGASRLVFWAKGNQGGEKVRFFTGGIGVCGDPYPDSLRPSLSTDVLTLSNQWQRYTIDLRGRDLSRIVGGFGLSASMDSNPSGATFYLDDIAFEADATPIPTPTPTPRPASALFPVYTDFEALGNHYFATGWMGAIEDITLDEAYRSDIHSGETAIRVSYTDLHSPGWAGIYWQDPASNWADRPGGYDLRGVERVSFWAKSITPGAQITFLVGGIGYNSNTCTVQPSLACPQYVDSLCPVVSSTRALTTDWRRYGIAIPPGQDLSRVVGGFGWTADRAVTFLLDDVVWEYGN